MPSTLNSFLGNGSRLIGSFSHFAYSRFRKFSVAPESSRDIVSALFEFEWIKTRTVIDFRADMYTFEFVGLISADLIRLRENPVGLLRPWLGRVFLYSPWIRSLAELAGPRRGLLRWLLLRGILGYR